MMDRMIILRSRTGLLETLGMAQFSAIWWARAHVQLLAQASVRKELMPLGALHNRWQMLTRLANEEGVRTAMRYDEATWATAAQHIAAGVGFDTRKL